MKSEYTPLDRRIAVAFLDALQSVLAKQPGSHASSYFTDARTNIADGTGGPATFELAKREAVAVYAEVFSNEKACNETVVRTFELVGKAASDAEIRATGRFLYRMYGGAHAKEFEKKFLHWRASK